MFKTHNNLVLELDTQGIQALEQALSQMDMELEEFEYGLFRASGHGITITAYKNGKVLLQGKRLDEFMERLQAYGLVNKGTSSFMSKESNALSTSETGEIEPWIGTDESGKGDFFGPLVIAGVYLDGPSLKKLEGLPIRDSKLISDSTIKSLAKNIGSAAAFSIVSIGPDKYNELYDRMKNLNRLLAWGHARVIENLLSQVQCSRAVTDQFGDKGYVVNALMERGKLIRLEQRPKAEDDIAVAAASILARNEFLMRLGDLSQEVGLELPKGASSAVEEAGRLLVGRHGPHILRKVAKLHFKTAQKILT